MKVLSTYEIIVLTRRPVQSDPICWESSPKVSTPEHEKNKGGKDNLAETEAWAKRYV
jgi:hypothetical protein